MGQQDVLQRQITSAVLQLRLRSPFFATLALFARIQMTETVPTAATDGRDIFINERFWGELTPALRLGLMAHEVLHAALLHVPRRGTREPLLWNIAADIVVNGIILAQEGFELPAGHLRDKELEHLSVEEIYHLLQERRKQYTSFTTADLLWSNGPGRDGYAGLEEYWRQALQHAKTLAETMRHGTQSAGLERELTQMSAAQLDWRAYLWRFLVRTPNDFQGYDRRFIGQRLYLETLEGESVRVYVSVDTSGSIGSKEISLFLGEVVGILSAYPHLVASLYYADAACYGPYPLTERAEIPRPVGGGGTDFRPFFEAVQEEHKQADTQDGVCIYLTDGCGRFPEEAPALPVLWVLSPGGLQADKVPFGETVRLIPE